VPGEDERDVDELVSFVRSLAKRCRITLGISTFVSKRNTPLDGLPFAGIDVVEGRLARLRKGVKGRVDVRATSARWAYIEYVLAQGGAAEGLALYEAVRNGGRFADYKRAFEALPQTRKKRPLAIAAL
jgi:hypothetical protein